MIASPHTRIEISLDAIEHNVSIFRSKLSPKTQILAIVKANSYGMGDIPLIKHLTKLGIKDFAIATVDEGVSLRKSGCDARLWVLNPHADQMEDVLQYKLELEIYSVETLKALENHLNKMPSHTSPIYVHLKVETGLHRLGLTNDLLSESIEILRHSPMIKVRSVFSHLSSNHQDHKADTLKQIRRYEEIVKVIESSLSYPFYKHILSSWGIINYSKYQYDMIRLAIGMYGVERQSETLGLKCACRWVSTLLQTKEVPAGEIISYLCAYRTNRRMKIGIVGAGYGHGIPRNWGNHGGYVSIHGVKAPIVGKVCMDSLMVDLTNVEKQHTRAGTEVVLMGVEVPYYEVAEKTDTITHELLTRITHRVRRSYV